MHRRLDKDIIGMRIGTQFSTMSASYLYKVETVGGLYRVFALKPGQKVIQQF